MEGEFWPWRRGEVEENVTEWPRRECRKIQVTEAEKQKLQKASTNGQRLPLQGKKLWPSTKGEERRQKK